MKIAFCYENVQPARGGCATYISDLARRLAVDGHEVHLYACRWDAAALPATLHYHSLPAPRGPRWLRPWRFAATCEAALHADAPDVSLGFDKTWGQDILYPQGGLHIASAEHNLRKYRRGWMRSLARVSKAFDLAHRSYLQLERRQYLGPDWPIVLAISDMVRRHFETYYEQSPCRLQVLRCAIDPGRFVEQDRPRRRLDWRREHGIAPEETVALFAAMNYRLKGIEPLLRAVKHIANKQFRLVVVGHPQTAVFERQARRLGVTKRVHFAGYCGAMRNAYFAADFLVHPTFYDPCSLVALEALACGLPVITTRYNGASELLTPPRDGYVIDDPHDHRQLAWCMEQLLNPTRRAACSVAARRTATQWTFEHHYQQLLQVFEQIVSRKQAA